MIQYYASSAPLCKKQKAIFLYKHNKDVTDEEGAELPAVHAIELAMESIQDESSKPVQEPKQK